MRRYRAPAIQRDAVHDDGFGTFAFDRDAEHDGNGGGAEKRAWHAAHAAMTSAHEDIDTARSRIAKGLLKRVEHRAIRWRRLTRACRENAINLNCVDVVSSPQHEARKIGTRRAGFFKRPTPWSTEFWQERLGSDKVGIAQSDANGANDAREAPAKSARQLPAHNCLFRNFGNEVSWFSSGRTGLDFSSASDWALDSTSAFRKQRGLKMTRIMPGMCHLAGLFQWRAAAASLTLTLIGAGPASAQDRSRPILRDAREVTSVGAVQRAADDSISAARVKLPRLPSLEDLQDQQLAEMSEQIGGLKAENSRLRTQLASFRDEIDGIKSAMRPPPGYAAAFTTKRNWDGLEDGVGIKYYAPYPR